MLVLKKIIKLFFKEEFFIPLLIFIAMFISVIPNIYYLLNTPKDTYYTLPYNYIPDYYQYISHMKSGADGKFFMTLRSSPDNFDKKPIYIFYTFSGFILSKIGIDLFTGFFLMRIIFCFIKLIAIYYLLLYLFPKSSGLRKLSFFFILFSTPFYMFKPLQMLYSTITSVDPLMRVLFLPHDSFTISVLILASIFINRWLTKTGSVKDIFISALFLLLAIIANPAMLTTFSFYLAFAFAIYLIKKRDDFKRLLIGLVLIGLITLPVFLYYQVIITTTLPFSLAYNLQKVTNYHVGLREFVIFCGPIIFLAAFSINKFFNKDSFLSKLIITWAIIPFILFKLFGKYLPISHERILESCFYIPLGILAGATVCNLSRKKIKIIIIALFIIISIPYYYLSLKNQLKEYNGSFMNVFVPKSVVEAFNWLDKNSKDESVVVTGYFSGNLLPAFSHNKVMFGHEGAYKGKERWDETMIIYYSNSTPQQIREVLDRENVRYILFTPDIISYEQTKLSNVNNIRLVFSNSTSSIYYYDK